jgi:hypothetical protein
MQMVAFSAQRCESCHPEVVERYRKTPMALSAGNRIPVAGAVFLHPPSTSTLRVLSDNGTLIHSVERDGIRATYPVSLAIGSGRVGQSYAVSIAGDLFQSPISWYTQSRTWGISPGFEAERNPDFDRPITGTCLSCHSSPSTLGPVPIGCERCHGNGDAHSVAPGRNNIVQPARLSPSRRDSVCEQCHLQGAARIARLNKRESDYQPGTALEDFVTIFNRQNQDFRVVSHAEQLRLSACARASNDTLWCGSCHDPHPLIAPTRATYNQRCESCHAGVKAKHTTPAEDCVACHMPSRAVSDVAHTAYTDHRISKLPFEAAPSAPGQLKAWRASPDISREFALALAATGDLASADAQFKLLLHASSRDVELLVSAGSVALGLNRPQDATRYFEAARKLEPDRAEHYFRKGLAHEANQQPSLAEDDYKEALRRKPQLFDATARLAALQRKNGDLDAYRKTLTAFLATMPQNITVRKLLR